jgi:DNA-directed RNA polymerase specialized sigma24 family protein
LWFAATLDKKAAAVVNDRNTSSQNPSPLSPCDEQAARENFDRFARRLIGLARTRLDRRIRQKIDPEDVVQSVFRSFFTRHGWSGSATPSSNSERRTRSPSPS